MKKNTKIVRLTDYKLLLNPLFIKKYEKEAHKFYDGDEDFMDDMDWVKSVTVPGFTKEELYEIKERVIRLLSPGFHEDYEVGAYLSSVADEDPKIEKLLVKWLKSQGVNFYQPEYRSDTGYFDYMEDETSTPIKPITIHGKTYKFVEDLPIRELGIGGYTVDNENGIVMVDGDTPLQDWLTQDMDVEDYMDEDGEFDDEEDLVPIGVDNLESQGTSGLVLLFSPLESDMVKDWNNDKQIQRFVEEERLFLNELSYDEWEIYGIEGDRQVRNYIMKNYSW